MRHYLLVFRAVSATALAVTSVLVTTVTGGVRRRAVQAMLCTAICYTTMAIRASM
jgi:hypothetical protein